MKIQFCHADRRPKMRVSIVSAPPKRRFASRPVSASGDRLARSSSAMRISSAQSRSSGVAVTRPSASRRPRDRAACRSPRAPRRSAAPSSWKRASSRVLAVHHRVRAEILRRQHDRGARSRLVGQRQHVAAIGRERQLRAACRRSTSPARSARRACATTRRGARACGAACRRLADEPVAGVPLERRIDCAARAPRRPRCAAPTCRSRARWCAAIRIASSSSRAIASGHHAAPAASMRVDVVGRAAPRARARVNVATRRARSIATSTCS